MPEAESIRVVAGHKTGYQHDLALARAALDEAADAHDLPRVKTIQAEIASLDALIESCDRRIAKMRQGATAAEQQARREDNDAALIKYRSNAAKLAPQARRIMRAVDVLASELQAFHGFASSAAEGYRHLAAQLTGRTRETALDFVGAVRYVDGALGVSLSEELRRRGVFATLAPTANVQLQRLDLPPMDELVESRCAQLLKRTDDLHRTANATIGGEQ